MPFKVGEYVLTWDGTFKVLKVRESDILRNKVTFEYLLETKEGNKWYHSSAIKKQKLLFG